MQERVLGDDDELLVAKVLEEDLDRMEEYAADYDPITGEGLDRYLGEERVKLSIPDFPIPVQWVRKEVMENKLIKAVLKAGGIQKFIDKKKWKDGQAPGFEDVVRSIRRIRHKHDFCHWAFFCIHIEAKLGGRIRFKLNYAQLKVLKQCLQMLYANVPINIIIDKARQWGGSTFCIFFQFFILAHWDPYHSFAVAAHINNAAHNILRMLRNAITEYPAWDLGCAPTEVLHLANDGQNTHAFVVKDSADNIVLPGQIFIGSAASPDSLRSGRISGAHYSEVGVWKDTPGMSAADLVADISGGIPKQQPLTMQVYESTAKEADDYFHDLCYDALDGKSNFTVIFIPFFFIPHDTMKIPDKPAFARWLIANRKNDKPEEGWKSTGKYFWWLWEQGATLEAIQWYRYEEKNYTTRAQMVNEAPASLPESFQSNGKKVFDYYDVDRMKRGCINPVYEGDLVSDGITGEDVLNNIRFLSREGGDLKIYEMPDDSPISDRYVVAVDIGGPNPTSDYSSVRVMDRLMLMPDFGLEGRPNVVAEMHYHTDPDILAYDAMRLAEFYGHALLVFESNTYEMRDKKRDTGVESFEYILDIVAGIYDNLYARRGNEEDMDGEKVKRKWGFRTDGITKPKIINHMKICLRDELWKEPSKVCCMEMFNYVIEDKKMTAPSKKHDDVLMATAILLWVAIKEMDTPQWIRREDTQRQIIHSNNNSVLY